MTLLRSKCCTAAAIQHAHTAFCYVFSLKIDSNRVVYYTGRRLKNAKKLKANPEADVKEIEVELLQGIGPERYQISKILKSVGNLA